MAGAAPRGIFSYGDHARLRGSSLRPSRCVIGLARVRHVREREKNVCLQSSRDVNLYSPQDPRNISQTPTLI